MVNIPTSDSPRILALANSTRISLPRKHFFILVNREFRPSSSGFHILFGSFLWVLPCFLIRFFSNLSAFLDILVVSLICLFAFSCGKRGIIGFAFLIRFRVFLLTARLASIFNPVFIF